MSICTFLVSVSSLGHITLQLYTIASLSQEGLISPACTQKSTSIREHETDVAVLGVHKAL